MAGENQLEILIKTYADITGAQLTQEQIEKLKVSMAELGTVSTKSTESVARGFGTARQELRDMGGIMHGVEIAMSRGLDPRYAILLAREFANTSEAGRKLLGSLGGPELLALVAILSAVGLAWQKYSESEKESLDEANKALEEHKKLVEDVYKSLKDEAIEIKFGEVKSPREAESNVKESKDREGKLSQDLSDAQAKKDAFDKKIEDARKAQSGMGPDLYGTSDAARLKNSKEYAAIVDDLAKKQGDLNLAHETTQRAIKNEVALAKIEDDLKKAQKANVFEDPEKDISALKIAEADARKIEATKYADNLKDEIDKKVAKQNADLIGKSLKETEQQIDAENKLASAKLEQTKADRELRRASNLGGKTTETIESEKKQVGIINLGDDEANKVAVISNMEKLQKAQQDAAEKYQAIGDKKSSDKSLDAARKLGDQIIAERAKEAAQVTADQAKQFEVQAELSNKANEDKSKSDKDAALESQRDKEAGFEAVAKDEKNSLAERIQAVKQLYALKEKGAGAGRTSLLEEEKRAEIERLEKGVKTGIGEKRTREREPDALARIGGFVGASERTMNPAQETNRLLKEMLTRGIPVTNHPVYHRHEVD